MNTDKDKHIGYPIPTEAWNSMQIPVKNIDEEWKKHTAYSELLDIPLKCPHCGEVLKTNERKEERQK